MTPTKVNREIARALLALVPLAVVPYPQFLNRIVFAPFGECWIWTGSQNRDGYGTFGACYQTVLAHRFAYQYWTGPIPDGMHIDHLCYVRECVNPAHLEAVTKAENNRRMNERLGNGAPQCKRCGYSNWCYLASRAGERQCRECARRRAAQKLILRS